MTAFWVSWVRTRGAERTRPEELVSMALIRASRMALDPPRMIPRVGARVVPRLMAKASRVRETPVLSFVMGVVSVPVPPKRPME